MRRSLMEGERTGDRPRARSDVDDGDGPPGDDAASLVDERLSLRPRDEDPRIDRESQSVELFPAPEVRDRLTGVSPLHEGLEALRVRVREWPLGVREDVLFRRAGREREQEIGV